MRGCKTSNSEKAKVITAKVGGVDKTLREIETETGVNYETVRKIIKEDLPEVLKSSDILAKIVDQDLRIIYMATQTARRFTEETLEAEEIDRAHMQTVNQLADSAMRRFMLFGDRVERAKERVYMGSLQTMTTEELIKIAEGE